jgi:uncharacterized membrane protein YfcA
MIAYTIVDFFVLLLYIMDYILIALTSLLASALTFFSGFGLNTLLMPVFALFFPLDIAISLTAVVHVLNNCFKLGLIGKYTQWNTVFYFGLPALVASFAGAYILIEITQTKPLYTYNISSRTFTITWIKMITGSLVFIFMAMEGVPKFKKFSVSTRWIPFGGLLSGFFGGLSGHQGALRSVFLVRLTMEKKMYVATGASIAFMIDIARLTVYGQNILSYTVLRENIFILLVAVTSAFAGAGIGNFYLKKMTYKHIQKLVTLFLIVIAMGLMIGIL